MVSRVRAAPRGPERERGAAGMTRHSRTEIAANRRRWIGKRLKRLRDSLQAAPEDLRIIHPGRLAKSTPHSLHFYAEKVWPDLRQTIQKRIVLREAGTEFGTAVLH